MIGEYESAFLVDLVASYLFEKAKSNFHPRTYYGIYRDDVLVVFIGKNSAREVKYWLEESQKKVNKSAVNQHLQFTAEKWMTGENSLTPAKEERVQIATNDEFPFLDMKISWSQEGELQFRVFR